MSEKQEVGSKKYEGAYLRPLNLQLVTRNLQPASHFRFLIFDFRFPPKEVP